LALKWRPRLFADAIGQEAITTTLKNSINGDKIGHAYLMTGTRGIGKTTVARIFAKALRCSNRTAEAEPCLVCDNCTGIDSGQSLDFIEIDGASNNSVDDIRDLIENVQYLPTNGKYKVYLIDEIHMLSVNAFNALLKTLEEPPKHVIFILATTDPQKLLGTVLSRCLRFDFRNAKEDDLVNHLNNIAKAEGINFENQTIPKVLAKQGKGSFRDTLSLFDQVISLSADLNITEETLYLSLGMANTKSVNQILEAILRKDQKAVLETYNTVMAENIDFKNYCLQILDKLYDIISSVNTNTASDSDSLNSEVMAEVSLPELLWIYETLFRDLEWSFTSLDPQKTTSFVLMKVSLREMILSESHAPIELKKKPLIEEIIPESVIETAETIIEPVIEPIVETIIEPIVEAISDNTEAITVPDEDVVETKDVEKSWEGFIKHLYQDSRAIGVNLERGNLINRASFGVPNSTLNIGFSEGCRIFYDFLNEYENNQRLISELSEYLDLSKDEISLHIKILNDEAKEKTGFRSSVEIEEEEIEADKDKRRHEIRENKYIVEATELFNSDLQKIILNEES
jgi:DNA polymerase-3 subunit gamma/tau